MGIRTVEEHLRSLRDDRVVFFKGQRVSDVTSHPVLGIGARHASLDFQLAEDPAFQELMTYIEPAAGERCSRFFKLPESAEDLLRRRLMIETSTRRAAPRTASASPPTTPPAATTTGAWRWRSPT